MFIIIGKDKKIKYINMEGCSVLGDEIEEIVGKEILDFIPKNKKDNIDGIITGILSEDLVGINGFEIEILTKNGDKKNIECNISLIYDNENIVSGFIMSGNDRTAEKILESERERLLLEMRGRIREIECLYSIAIFAQSGKELDSKFVDAILKVWKNPEKLSGRIILNNSEYRSSLFKRTNLLLEKKLYSNEEMIGRIEIFSEDKMSLVKIENISSGEENDFLEVLYKMLENIILSKKLEEKLINNNILLKETQEIAKLGTWEYDIEKNEIFWSEETYNIFGIKNREKVDYGVYMENVYPDSKAVAENPFALLEKDRKLKNKLVEFKKADGKQGFAVSNARLVVEKNIPKKIIGSLLDITEMKMTQMELEKAREESESSNKAKTLFIANMSHEIRTPLNAILGFSQLLLRNNSIDSEGKKQLGVVMKSGEHLLSIINSILELAKIETGKIVLEKEEFEIPKMIKEVTDMFINKVKEKGLKISYEVEGENNRCYIGDEKKIKQIYINLIGNAVKFTEKGSIEIKINIVRESEGKVRINSSVKDTGIGIPESYTEKAFKRFEQAENNVWKKGGTGLGLAITKEFLNFMEGDIEVTSKLNEGSEFKFYYYLKESKEISRNSCINRVLARGKDEKEIRALIVDDVENNIMVLKECLKVVRVESDEARDGKKAVKMSVEKNYDIIFMDIVMPVLDGITATKEIRKQNDKTIIVAVTASVFEEEKQKIMEYGVDEFIRKPYKEEEIYDILKRRFGISYIYQHIEKEENGNEKLEEESNWKEKIPKETIEIIKDAVINGDVDKIIETAENINQYDECFAGRIKNLANGYKFEELNKIFEI